MLIPYFSRNLRIGLMPSSGSPNRSLKHSVKNRVRSAHSCTLPNAEVELSKAPCSKSTFVTAAAKINALLGLFPARSIQVN